MNKKSFTVVTIIGLLLLALSFAGNIYGFTIGDKFGDQLQFLCNLAAVVFAFMYLIVGCKKEGSSFFKIFMWLLVFKEAAALINMAIYEQDPPIALILILVCYTATAILAVSMNLGKTRSFVFVGILIVVSAICLIYTLIGNELYNGISIYNATRLVLAIISGVFIYAKYEDKASRGSK